MNHDATILHLSLGNLTLGPCSIRMRKWPRWSTSYGVIVGSKAMVCFSGIYDFGETLYKELFLIEKILYKGQNLQLEKY